MKDKIGTYLTLWHGRKTPDEELNDWGETGPTFGPFEDVTITYASHVKAAQGAKTLWLNFTGDLIEYRGMYYGDFTIFAGEATENGQVIKLGDRRWENPVTKFSEIPKEYLH